MASMEEPTFPLRLFIDQERNQVVLAEATGDFIDILFSFLTLPLGTIIRLVSHKQPHPHQPANIGCINNLYRAVENMNGIDFQNHICKEMLLFPRNPCESICKKLTMNVDDTHTRFFMCRNHRSFHEMFLSNFEGAICGCGRLMNQEVKVVDSEEEKEEDGVFVKGKALYLIFDDVKVMHSSLGNSVQQLVQLGYNGFNRLKEMSLNVGYNEILELLKQAMISKSPLTDVFLEIGMTKSKPTDYSVSPKLEQKFKSRSPQMNVKITTSKSKNKILYAEAEEDFIDFLFSFLTMPLGSILNLLDANSSVGSIDNLYKSVRALNPPWCTKLCTMLLNPGVAPLFGCKNQPMQILEQAPPIYWFGDGVYCNNMCYTVKNGGVVSRERKTIQRPQATRLYDPRSADGAGERAVGFVKRPAVFAVCDDLQVIPLTSSSSISFLKTLDVSLDDFDEHVVGIGETEALQLLRASLSSKSALTEGLFCHLNKREEAPC